MANLVSEREGLFGAMQDLHTKMAVEYLADLSAAELTGRLLALEEEKHSLQEIVCGLLQKNEELRRRLRA